MARRTLLTAPPTLPREIPSVLWTRYVQLTQIKSVFRSLKSELGIRPIYHPLEHRADAHILICLSGPLLTDHLEAGSLAARTWVDAGGQCWRSRPAEIQMIEVWIPAVDQRWLILPRFTQPSPDTKLVIEKLRLELPNQPPPRLTAQTRITKSRSRPSGRWALCGEDLSMTGADLKHLAGSGLSHLRKIG